jgi:hypothetical protein
VEQACKYFKWAADTGDINGADEFAAEMVNTDDRLVLVYFRRVEEGGHPNAVFWIGVSHDHARAGFDRDYRCAAGVTREPSKDGSGAPR